MRTTFCLGVVYCVALVIYSSSEPGQPESSDRHRSPIDVAVLPGGKRALTANHTSASVSLVDLDTGKVVTEISCEEKPAGVAISPNGKYAAVSHLWSGTISFFSIRTNTVRKTGQLAVGGFPRELAFTPDGKSLFVACAASDEVVHIETNNWKVIRRLPAPRELRHLAISADGHWLAAASSRTAKVRVWNLRTGKLHWVRTIPDAFNLRDLVFTPNGKSLICAHVVRREFPVAKDNIEKGWVTDSRLTKFALDADALPNSWQIALDVKGRAVGDPHGLAFTTDGQWLAVTASGTHELLLLKADALPWNAGDPGDVIHDSLKNNRKLFRRIPLKGRPLAVTAADRRLVVANYLQDALQIVTPQSANRGARFRSCRADGKIGILPHDGKIGILPHDGKLLRSISLGRPREISLARKGEELFYDTARSHNQWFSCHTCHTEGHTSGMKFDTLNDGSYGNPKMTPSLRNVTKTGPWTWHGWQQDLGAAFVKSSTTTMFGRKPTAAETKAMVAFLGTLTVPPNPNRRKDGSLPPAALRGKEIFHGKARCSRCHSGEFYTSANNYQLEIGSHGSPYKVWNPPSLLGLFDRGPYFHDGRATTLDEVLEKHQLPNNRRGAALTPAERSNLTEFLRAM